MPTNEELVAIKDRATAQLLALSNVTGVGIGGRVRAGERINELVLKVYVAKKLPPEQVDAADLIPAEFEGIPTDVAVLPATGTLAQAPTGKPEISVDQADDRRQRPLVGGSKIQVDLAGAGFGTLGCMFVNMADLAKVYAFTNWHVLLGRGNAAPTVGTTKAGQPSSKDSVTACCSSIIGKVAGGNRDTTSDVGLVQLAPGTQWKADILEIGSVAGKHPITPVEAGTHPPVRKRGARSGLTGGTVDSIGFTANVDGITYNNVIVIAPNPDTAQPAGTALFFDQHGDSGSALLNDNNEVVGIVFAVPNGPYSGLVTGWALPIEDLISAISAHVSVTVDVAVGILPGIVNTVPGAPMVAIPQEVAPALTGASEPVRVPVGGAALFQLLVRMVSESQLALPTALHGEPLASCIDRLYVVFHRFASPRLQSDLARAHDGLPELGGLSYDGICSALAAH
jgi:hypothetical protein